LKTYKNMIDSCSRDPVRRILFALPVLLFSFCAITCSFSTGSARTPAYGNVVAGAERVDQYLPLLEDKRVGIVANHTSMIGNTHLVDSLLSLGVNIRRIFTPEHGFRGTADAGQKINTSMDEKTGLPLISLYGNNLKPSAEDMMGLDIVIYDIQDVGARFYTYISTMHYVMEACAENGISFLVLDRPNPNGFYVDGPVLDMDYRSFVGMHPVPIVHGMTVAEYARMIKGEGWLSTKNDIALHYVLCGNYDHLTLYRLPVRPSPNLQTQLAIYLYPSLCLFEGTIVSLGRGTSLPFMVFGHPQMVNTDFQFTPISVPGATNPPLLGEKANGIDLSGIPESYFIERRSLNLEWLLFAYNNMPRELEFFNGFFNRLAGCGHLRQWIESGMTLEEITATWEKDVIDFKRIRSKYLLYDDFE
jgi:uncharacterized protein YbbC (DUF1343 family)